MLCRRMRPSERLELGEKVDGADAGAGSSSRQFHKRFTLKTGERNQPAAERTRRRSGVEWSHLGRTVEPFKRKYKFWGCGTTVERFKLVLASCHG